jgi:hypothetical protein
MGDGDKQKTAAATSRIALSGFNSLKRLPPQLLFPSLEDVIQCRIQGSPQTFLHQGHNLRFKNGFLFLLSFLFLATHLIFTSLVM